MTSAYDYSELHELIDHLEPEQAEELRRHALRLVKPAPIRFRILRSFDGPATDLGARAKDVVRAEIGEGDADR
ncbi:hypothetical protein ABZY09_11045 [Streptomyces sp. NPDC002928]|uniref:hypothetical protein n=1 Tax=Streptomyces sp. NPDC002928 TaxID=3154440 RepID=UPI00339F2143